MTLSQPEAPTNGLAGGFAKALAIASIALALRLATPAAPPARVVLLVLPGVDSLDLASLEATHGVWGGALRDGSVGSAGGAFWRRFLDILREDHSFAPRLLGAPLSLVPEREAAPAAVRGFLGGNSGVVLDSREIALRRLPPAYAGAREAVPPAMEGLRRGERTDWIPVSDGAGRPAGAFLVVRSGEDSCFFSPVHREGAAVAPEAAVTVSRPFFRGVSPELTPAVVEYLRALGNRRFDEALPGFRRSVPGDGVVYFDLTAEDVADVFLPAETSERIAGEVRRDIRSRIETLLASLGPQGVIVLAGGPHLGRADDADAWYRVVSGSGGAIRGLGDLDLSTTGGPVLRYLLGAQERAEVPKELLARYPRRRAASPPPATSNSPVTVPWAAETIGSAQGSVPGSV